MPVIRIFSHYKNNEGQFEVSVPLRNATFEFQPDWPALKNLDIDLEFPNNGLWMKATDVALGDVNGHNITVVIPDYLQRKIDYRRVTSAGQGNADTVTYFNSTPLKDSLGTALEELQIGGDVSGHLHLDMPLDGR